MEGRQRTGPLTAAGARLDYTPGTLFDLFRIGLQANPDGEGMRRRRPDGSWESFTRRQVAARVRGLALGLRTLGYTRQEPVAILAPTRMEWALADYAIILADLTSLPIYPSLPVDQIEYMLGDGGARAVFVSDHQQLEKVQAVAGRLPRLERAFVFDPAQATSGALDVLDLEGLADLGGGPGASGSSPRAGSGDAPGVRAAQDGDLATWRCETRPEDLATLIYTSGTTGPPKGVMLTHANFHSNTVLSLTVFRLSTRDVALSWLPLAHSFERMAGHYCMWYSGAAVAYAESYHTVPRDLQEVRPTVMTAVPLLYEKFYDAAIMAARSSGPVKRRLFFWAKQVGEQRVERRQHGGRSGPWLAGGHAIADRLVWAKLRRRMGGRIRYFLSGGAALAPPLARFFHAAGLPILEGYGLTETSPVVCVNPHEDIRIGTVGPPIPNTEVRIAADGEILVRGPQVMEGYFHQPEATRAAIDADGWFHTGDVGELDRDGYLSITDRKKDLIVTATGKNIAPQPIENTIRESPYIDQAVVLGDGRKFPIVLVVPALERLRAWASGQGIVETETARLLKNSRVRGKLSSEALERVGRFAHHEQPRAVLPVPDEFGVQSGELTPSLKVKRRVVADKYAQEIEALYERLEREHGSEGASTAAGEAGVEASRRSAGHGAAS